MEYRNRDGSIRIYGTCKTEGCVIPLTDPRRRRCPEHGREHELMLKRKSGKARRRATGDDVAEYWGLFLYGR